MISEDKMTNSVKIDVCASVCAGSIYEALSSRYGIPASSAAQIFFAQLVHSLTQQACAAVSVVSLLPLGRRLTRLLVRFGAKQEDGITYYSIPHLAIPVIGNVFTFAYVFFYYLFCGLRRPAPEYVIVDYLRYTLNLAVIFAAKIRGFKVVAVVTDMPGLGLNENFLLEKLRYKCRKLFEFDGYILVSWLSNQEVNPRGRPHLVLEGFLSPDLEVDSNEIKDKCEKRVIVYAGTLDPLYGIDDLVDAFNRLPGEDLRLWLFGDGAFVKELKNIVKQDRRIEYKGSVPHSELLNVLRRAHLLVNPRPIGGQYALYSFPSKNIEYMGTGTPLLTTKLPSIPEDHFNYVYTISGRGSEGIRQSLLHVLSQSLEDRHRFGACCRKYVIETKTTRVQGRRILELLLKMGQARSGGGCHRY